MRPSKPIFKNNKKNSAYNKLRLAIVSATWNSEFNQAMQKSASNLLKKQGVKHIDCFEVPGAFELPVFCAKLCQEARYNAIICLATVIKGETLHFEIVANEASRGIMDVSIQYQTPIINGILACNNEEQAKHRASPRAEDKGSELAFSALKLLDEIAKI